MEAFSQMCREAKFDIQVNYRAGNIMIIVGVGAGPQMLTAQAAQAVEKARLIYGSKRAIDLVMEHINSGYFRGLGHYGKQCHEWSTDYRDRKSDRTGSKNR